MARPGGGDSEARPRPWPPRRSLAGWNEGSVRTRCDGGLHRVAVRRGRCRRAAPTSLSPARGRRPGAPADWRLSPLSGRGIQFALRGRASRSLS